MLDKSGQDELRAMADQAIPIYSEEALALEYAKEHAPYLRYVADSPSIWRGSFVARLRLMPMKTRKSWPTAPRRRTWLSWRGPIAGSPPRPISGTLILGFLIRRAVRLTCAPEIYVRASRPII